MLLTFWNIRHIGNYVDSLQGFGTEPWKVEFDLTHMHIQYHYYSPLDTS